MTKFKIFIFRNISQSANNARWSVAMRFAPGSAGFVFSSGVGVNAKWRRVIL
jgi:hypothetical protein